LAVGALAIAHQADLVEAEFSGVIETTEGTSFRRLEVSASASDEIEWSFNSFTATREEIRWYILHQRILGEIDLSGDRTGEVGCTSSYLEDFPYTTRQTVESGFQFVIFDLPLASAIVEDSNTLLFELSGPDVQNHVKNIRCYQRYRYTQSQEWTYTREYVATDWNNEESPPKVSLLFLRR
jgi:hypothetical protein